MGPWVDDSESQDFMTIPESAKFILQAKALGKGGELFILGGKSSSGQFWEMVWKTDGASRNLPR